MSNKDTMSNTFFNQNRCTIANDIFNKIMYDIDNLIILSDEKTIIFKTIEYINNYTGSELNQLQKHYLCIDVITQLVNCSNNSDVNKNIALSTFPLKIFDYFSQIEEEEEKEKKREKNINIDIDINVNIDHLEDQHAKMSEDEDENEESLDSFNEIVNELYESICNVIKMENIKPNTISLNLFNIINKIVTVLSKYEKLKWKTKKIVIIKTFDKVKDNLNYVFPNITDADIKLVKNAFNNIPNIIDSVFSIYLEKCNQIFGEVMSNPIVNGFANMFVSLMKPPQVD
jgi:hypothetical protein